MEAKACVPNAKLDYFDIVDKNTFEPITHKKQSPLACVAIFFDDVRLIDNLPL